MSMCVPARGIKLSRVLRSGVAVGNCVGIYGQLHRGKVRQGAVEDMV